MKIFGIILFAILPFASYAVCPVCTVAVGAGLEGARLLGVDDVITGIWAGGLTLSIFFWTAGWLKRRGVKSFMWYAVVPFVLSYGMLAGVYLLPDITFGANKLWGIDKLLLGMIIGTVAFYIGARIHNWLKNKNNGKVYFPFQKVFIPFALLLVLTAVFATIIYL